MISYQLAPGIKFHIPPSPDVKITAVTLKLWPRGRGGGGGGGGGEGRYAIRPHGNSCLSPAIDQLVINSCFFFHNIEIWCSPAQDLLPVDGVEVDDLVGLGRNEAVVKRSPWRRRGVWRREGVNQRKDIIRFNKLWGMWEHRSSSYRNGYYNQVITLCISARW